MNPTTKVDVSTPTFCVVVVRKFEGRVLRDLSSINPVSIRQGMYDGTRVRGGEDGGGGFLTGEISKLKRRERE